MLRNCIFQAIMEPNKIYIILIILHVEVLRVSFKLLFDCPTANSGLSSTGQPHSSYANHCSFTFLTTKVIRRLVMKLSIRHHELVNKELKEETKQEQSKYYLSTQLLPHKKVQSAGKREFLEKDFWKIQG